VVVGGFRRLVRVRRASIPAAEFLVGDIASIDFPPNSFDAVVAFFSLIHVPREDHGKLMERIAFWLRPGGWFVGTMGSGKEIDGIGDFLGVEMY
jgi:SAM-dependent methyltransferase